MTNACVWNIVDCRGERDGKEVSGGGNILKLSQENEERRLRFFWGTLPCHMLVVQGLYHRCGDMVGVCGIFGNEI